MSIESQLTPYADAPPLYQPAACVDRAAEVVQPTPNKRQTELKILTQSWDLALNIPPNSSLLRLDHNGKPTWYQTAADNTSTYRHSGFDVDLAQPEVRVRNHLDVWRIPEESYMAYALHKRRDDVTLESFGQHLVTHSRRLISQDRRRSRNTGEADEGKNAIRIECISDGVFNIDGLSGVCQLEGDNHDLVLRTPRFLRLWNIATREFRWRIRYIDGRVMCLSGNYILYQDSEEFDKVWLVQRKNGHVYGSVTIPIPSATSTLGNEPYSNIWRTESDLIVWNRPRALIIFRLSADVVEYRVWKSANEIRGAILVKGSLETLSVEIIGQEPCWSITQTIAGETIRKMGFKRLILMWI